MSVAFHSEDGASSPLPHELRYLPSHLSLNRTIGYLASHNRSFIAVMKFVKVRELLPERIVLFRRGSTVEGSSTE